MKIPLSNPDITELEKGAVAAVLDTPFLSFGPKIPEFEGAVADFAGVKYAQAMSSGTAVLHTLVRALGISQGDYVLTTPFSFISTANCLLYEGAKPIFVDIDENTYNISPEAVEKVLLSQPDYVRQRIKAVFYVDVFGVPANGEGFERLGKKYHLKIVEDSAEALGSKINGRKCGSFGNAGIFAFYPNKQITTGEGGMLVTNDPELARMAKSLRNQGRDEGAGWLQHPRLGFNYRMSDINAAIGLAQMKRIEEIVNKRRKAKTLYDNSFEGLFQKKILIPQLSQGENFISPFVYVLRMGDSCQRKDRDRLLDYLRDNGIGCSNYFTPIHLQKHFVELGWKYGDFPVTERISERTFALPFYSNLSEKQVEFVVNRVTEFFGSKKS